MIENKRVIVFFLVVCCSIGLLLGCSKRTSQEMIQVTDMLGTTIEVKKNPSKVACISRTTYDLLVAYGLGDKIDGAYSGTLNNDWVSFIYPNSKNHYVYSYENSYELFLQRGVDLVFAPEKYIADDLNSHNIPSVCVSLYGKSSFTEYAYRMMGFDFAGAILSTTKPSVEEIVKTNPDIFVAGGIYQNKNINLLRKTDPYKELDAVKKNKIYSIPIGFTAFEQLSAMTPIFFYDQVNKIYPEYFSYDISKMVKDTIKEYFKTELTDEQVSYMLNGLNPMGKSLVK